MAESQVIQSDVYCACGYNLRGLTAEHNCPECGRPAKTAVGIRHDPRAWNEIQQIHGDRAVRDGVVNAAMLADAQIDATYFVCRAQQYASFRHGGGDVTARQLCAALRDYARVEFGGENAAILELARMKLRSSKDVGRIIFALVKSGMLRKSEGESIRDFEGLFELDNLFSAEL